LLANDETHVNGDDVVGVDEMSGPDYLIAF
jgi:hypothetical protein